MTIPPSEQQLATRDECRKAFEEFMRAVKPRFSEWGLRKDESEEYELTGTQIGWRKWQACWNRTQPREVSDLLVVIASALDEIPFGTSADWNKGHKYTSEAIDTALRAKGIRMVRE